MLNAGEAIMVHRRPYAPPGAEPLPWKTNRCRRYRWIGQVDSAFAFEPVAAVATYRGCLQRMELVAAGARNHAARQEEEHVYAGDVQPDSCHRFRRPPGALHCSSVEGRRRRMRGSVQLHGLCARRSTWREPALGAESLS